MKNTENRACFLRQATADVAINKSNFVKKFSSACGPSFEQAFNPNIRYAYAWLDISNGGYDGWFGTRGRYFDDPCSVENMDIIREFKSAIQPSVDLSTAKVYLNSVILFFTETELEFDNFMLTLAHNGKIEDISFILEHANKIAESQGILPATYTAALDFIRNVQELTNKIKY